MATIKSTERKKCMTDKEHKAAGHIKDSTGRWVDPKDYIDTYYIDW